MEQMIEKNIQEYPGDNATLTEFFNALQCMQTFRYHVSKSRGTEVSR